MNAIEHSEFTFSDLMSQEAGPVWLEDLTGTDRPTGTGCGWRLLREGMRVSRRWGGEDQWQDENSICPAPDFEQCDCVPAHGDPVGLGCLGRD